MLICHKKFPTGNIFSMWICQKKKQSPFQIKYFPFTNIFINVNLSQKKTIFQIKYFSFFTFQQILSMYQINWHLFLFHHTSSFIHLHQNRSTWLQRHQFTYRLWRLSLSNRFQVLSQQYKTYQHCRSIKKHSYYTILFSRLFLLYTVMCSSTHILQNGKNRVKITSRCANDYQNIHIGPSMFHYFPSIYVEPLSSTKLLFVTVI